MAKRSAGILLYRLAGDGPAGGGPAGGGPAGGGPAGGGPEVLLVHPGGPFWAKRDAGAWSIPKGEYDADEDPLVAATREFEEELGSALPAGEPIELGTVKQAGGKLVTAWAVEGDFDPAGLRSNSFALEWPPRSGEIREFPEVDRAQWFSPAEARKRIVPAQAAFIDRLDAILAARRAEP